MNAVQEACRPRARDDAERLLAWAFGLGERDIERNEIWRIYREIERERKRDREKEI